MSPSNRVPLPLVAAFAIVALAGLVGPPRGTSAASRPGFADELFELVLFGTSLDDARLAADAAPLLVYRVPAGLVLELTDVDATAGGLVLMRRTGQQLEQVGFVVDRASVGLGQSARSYATGIPFGPGDELLVQAAGGDVEWAVLRGVVGPVAPPSAP